MRTLSMNAFVRVAPYLFFLLVAGVHRVNAQADVARVTVPANLLRQHVFALASDGFQGRKTGTDGQLQAALYCTQVLRQSHLLAAFKLDSLSGSFRQPFAFTSTDVVLYGGMRVYNSSGGSSNTYQKNELVPLPRTAADSSRVKFGHNLGAVIVGTDLKQEVIVISAHYDHLGNEGKRVFYGADDNASGTATVLGIASVFDSLRQVGIRSRRSILFLLFAGEEGGLLGSNYFVDNSPIPLSQLVADLNVDMVGCVDDAHRKKPDYCYLLTNSEGRKLQQVAERVNAETAHLSINVGGYDTHNDPERFFYRSDHYNFARIGVPALFFTNGSHSDYHKPSDTPERINYEVLTQRATLVFQTAWTLANENAN